MSDVWVATNTESGQDSLLHADLMRQGLILSEQRRVLYVRVDNPEGGPLTRLVESPSALRIGTAYSEVPPPMPTWFQADLVEALHRARTMRTESDPVLIVRAGVSDQHQWIWTVYRYEEFLDRRAVKAPPTDERG